MGRRSQCRSVCLSIYLSIGLFIYLSIYLSFNLAYLLAPVYVAISLAAYPSTYVSTYLSSHLTIRRRIHSVTYPIRLFFFLSFQLAPSDRNSFDKHSRVFRSYLEARSYYSIRLRLQKLNVSKVKQRYELDCARFARHSN